MPFSWISGDGFEVRGLPTRHGKIDFRIAQSDHDTIDVCIKGLREIPAGGLWIDPPLPTGTSIDGAPADGKRIEVNSLPFVAKLKLLRSPESNTA